MNPQALDLTWATYTMRELEEDMQLASHTDASVLLTGENGVGKRFAAHIIHLLSERRPAPFVAINAAQVLTPASTSTSSTAAPYASDFLRSAEGGTLLIQDIEHIPAEVQQQLLGFMDRRTTTTKNVRLMATTTTDLFGLVQAGSFSEELFYRLNMLAFKLPPLRERREEIPLMFRLYLSLHAGTVAPGLSTAAQRRLMEYSWPGNITELTSVTRTLSSRNLPELIDLEHLPCPLVACQSRDKEPRRTSAN
jgi:DNA-binding NtrC family response regulator